MNIGLHIAEILEERGKVSIQGLGTFYLKKTDAYFDDQRQMFFPRDRKLDFKLPEGDNSIFPEYISKAEDISSVAANHLIRAFAIKFNNELETSGTTEIAGLGKFKKEGSGYIIESFSSYGLIPLPESMTSNLMDDGNTIGEENTITGDHENLFTNAEDTEESVADDESETTPLWKWLLITLSILLLMAAGYFFYPELKELIQRYQPATVQTEQTPVITKPITPIPVDSIADSTQTQQTDSIKSTAVIPVTKPNSITNGTISYEIIIASFSQKSEAETYIAQWTAKSAKVHLIEQPLGTFKYKVSAGSFTDQALAQNELSLVQKNINKEAWIDQVKN